LDYRAALRFRDNWGLSLHRERNPPLDKPGLVKNMMPFNSGPRLMFPSRSKLRDHSVSPSLHEKVVTGLDEGRAEGWSILSDAFRRLPEWVPVVEDVIGL